MTADARLRALTLSLAALLSARQLGAQGASCATATQVSPNGEQLATLPSHGHHFYRVTTSAPGLLTFSTENSLDTCGTVYDASGIQVYQNCYSGPDDNFLISFASPAASYCIEVAEQAGVGGLYRFRSQADLPTDDRGSSCASATALTVNPNAPVTSLGGLSVYGDEDFFRFTIPAGGGTTTVQTEGQAQTCGRLYDNDGVVLRENCYSGSADNFLLEEELPAGTYCVGVRHPYQDGQGSYRFRLDGAYVGDDHGASCASATPVRKGQGQTADIPAILNVESDVDYFQVQVPSGGGQLDVYGEGNLQTCANLFDADGVSLAENCYSGPGDNFEISRTLPAGIYCVGVRGAYSDQLGPYRFRVAGTFLNPLAKCAAKNVTIHGTDGDDVIRGTAGADVIAGYGGNDVIIGGLGADTICGGLGDDTIYLGDGANKALGQEGNDILIGGAQKDLIDGGPGADICDGRGGTTDTAVGCEVVVGVP